MGDRISNSLSSLLVSNRFMLGRRTKSVRPYHLHQSRFRKVDSAGRYPVGEVRDIQCIVPKPMGVHTDNGHDLLDQRGFFPRGAPVSIPRASVNIALEPDYALLTMTPIDHISTGKPQGSCNSTSGARYRSGIHQS